MNPYPQIITKIVKKFPSNFEGDLLNELYIVYSQNKEKYNENHSSNASSDTYLYKRLYYACLDFINQSKKEVLSLDNYTIDSDCEDIRYIELIESDFDLQKEIEQNDLILSKLDSFNETEIEILNFRFYEGLTFKEIAKRLNISTKTARTKFKAIFSND